MVLKAHDCNFPEGDERRDVVINFYSNRDDFSQEVDVHNKLLKTADSEGLSSPTITIIQTFDMDRVGTSLEKEDDTNFSRDVTQFNDMYKNLSGFSYAIVRAKSEGDVDSMVSYNDIDKNYRIENKKQLKDIAEAMQCLHNNNYLLGDMQAGDFVKAHGSIKLRSVKSITQVDSNSKNIKFYGCVSQDFGISNLPPEMIAKLDTEGVEKYLMYWNREFNDFHIATEHTPEKVQQSAKVQAFLEEEGCSFDDFWTRVKQHAALWKRIRPRQVGNDYYVVKCYRSGKNGEIHCPEQLPYKPIPFTKELDVWYFGSLIFELITGESLLHSNKARNIVNDSDFERLFNWTMSHYAVSRRLNDIADPLARDLLRSLLTSPNTERQQNMEMVVNHPFFCNIDDEGIEEVTKEIIQEEKESAHNFKDEQDLKLRKYTLDKRTEKIPLISLETQQRFELSQWKMLGSTYDLSELTFPTSCVVLPYDLEKDSGGVLRSPTRNYALSCKLGLVIADILHYLSVVTNFEQAWTGQSFGHKIQEYVDMNRNATSAPEDNLIRICEGVITKSRNASAVIKDVADAYLTSGDTWNVANKLVSDTLSDIVDLDVCKKVVLSAEDTQNSITSLLSIVGEYPEKAAENMMNEQMRDVIGVEFTENSFAKKESIQNALMSLVQTFTENPLSVVEGILYSRISELIDIYTEMKVCYVYLVDEYSGSPIASGLYPFQVKFSLNVAKTLIPPMILAMRSNLPLGIFSLLGLTLDEVPPQWAKLAEFHLPSQETNSLDEIKTLQTTLGFTKDDGILPLLGRFFMKKDPEEHYAGLIRLSSPNGLIMWATQKSREEALMQAKNELAELHKKKTMKALEKITAIHENNTQQSADLWCSPQTSRVEIPQPTSPTVNSNVSQRWKATKEFDMEKSNHMVNQIQNKLDKLKGWTDQGTESIPASSPQHSSKADGYHPEVNDEAKVNSKENIESEQQTQIPISSVEVKHRSEIKHQNEDLMNHRTIRDSKKHFQTEEETLTIEDEKVNVVDENKDTANGIALASQEIVEKREYAGEEERGNIKIESVKSDISDSYVKGQWSPVNSDDEDTEDRRSKVVRNSSEKVRQYQQQPTAVAPRMFRRVGQVSPKRQLLENRDPFDDHASVASSVGNSRIHSNRLRSKSVSQRGSRGGYLSSSSIVSHKQSPKRIHPKHTPSMDSEESDRLRSPRRSRYDRVRPEVNE